MSNAQPHQEQLFDLDDATDEAGWKLDDTTRQVGRRGLAAVRDELEKHPGPVVQRKPRRPLPEYRSNAHVAKGYRNAA